MVALLLLALAVGSEPIPVPVESLPPQLSAERLQGIRAYRRRHLSLVTELQYRAVPQVTPAASGADPFATSDVFVREFRSVAIYQGALRIGVPPALELLGRPDLAVDTARRVQRNRRWGTTLYTLGGVGGLTAIGGFYAMHRSRGGSTQPLAGASAVAGLTAMGIGFVVGTFPATRGRRLAFDPTMTLPTEDIEAELDAYNDGLRLELGLRPSDVVLFERPPAPSVGPH
ncbi:MAG: hypothetical protein KC912_02210 [Proteobacteria bacterium]|nr:hypothetical protein [Pseudomonadota bacterium]